MGNSPGGELSLWGIVLVGNCPGRSYPLGSCSSGNSPGVLVGSCPIVGVIRRGIVLGSCPGELSGWGYPMGSLVGICPGWGELTGGGLSSGELSLLVRMGKLSGWDQWRMSRNFPGGIIRPGIV